MRRRGSERSASAFRPSVAGKRRGVNAALDKLRADGAGEAGLAAFARRLEQLADPDAGRLPGDELAPVGDLPRLDGLPTDDGGGLAGVAVVRLNGGLGTSMGLRAPKSLVEVKPGRAFLDVIAAQVGALRERHGVALPLVLMDSAATREATLAFLADRHPGLGARDFLQGHEPKLRADDHEPVRWPADPGLEWCPPGHGDVYVALASSGTLDGLLEAGCDLAFVANADNLGAVPDARVAAWARASGAPLVLEAVRGTPADRKGGHLACRDGRLVLRETAQVPDGDASFGDVDHWRFYNANNLWIDLRALRRLLRDDPAGPHLPLIVNHKTVDPTDPDSLPVLQLETAMGAAIGAWDGARALEVSRTRFAPVKTTDDLVVVRSDAYALREDGTLEPCFAGEPPVVSLRDARDLEALERVFPHGPPSLRGCRTLTVGADVVFGRDVVVTGDVTVEGPGEIAAGERLAG